MVLAVRDLKLDAMPKVAAAGSKIVLQGRIEGSFEDLRLLVSDGPASVRTVDFAPGSDGRFRIEVDAPTTEGSHLVEWTGEDPRGWRASLLAVPLYIGSQAPTTLELPLKSEVPNPPDFASWEALVLSRVNALRAQQNLEPALSHPARPVQAHKFKGLTVRGYQVYTASVLVPSMMRGDKSDSAQAPPRAPQTQAGVGACEHCKPGTDGNELAVFLLADVAPK